jgi:uncharacterized protein (DUF4415 family)
MGEAPDLWLKPRSDHDDNPEWSAADFARARPPEAVLPRAILAQFPNTRPVRGPQKAPTKIAVSLRLSRDVWSGSNRMGLAGSRVSMRRCGRWSVWIEGLLVAVRSG